MIECPWCSKQVTLVDHICPVCKHEVLPEHIDKANADADNESTAYETVYEELSIEEILASRFTCAKCKHDECHIKEVAMSGTGLSKIFDIEHNHFLFVSCMNCGFVEIYNPDILSGKKSGSLGTVLDILFGS
ncbi:zinc ribbon domain-containing protein [Paenibacillus sp. MBLB4367]|uniref:zinc ribbon domain-containing protein n=1 Tax=Paenibacillus sp. MBLB4367 TaxID=3384767 RepID=UPI0039081AFC